MDFRTKYNKYLLGDGLTAVKAVYNCLPWQVNSVVFMKPEDGSIVTGGQRVDLDYPIEDAVEGKYRVPSTFYASLVSLKPTGFTRFDALTPTAPVGFAPG